MPDFLFTTKMWHLYINSNKLYTAPQNFTFQSNQNFTAPTSMLGCPTVSRHWPTPALHHARPHPAPSTLPSPCLWPWGLPDRWGIATTLGSQDQQSGNPRGAGGPSKGAPGGLFSAPRKSVGGIAQTRPVQGGRGGQQLTLREVSRHVAEPVCRVRQVTRGPPGPRVCFSFRSQ